MTTEGAVRSIAFYLPQFHPIPENDEWWGPGFTEWRNVVKATPAFPGHYQPHLPADLGFYDLRLSETREAQAELAAMFGIDAFCYYHYWFGGRRLLERPFQEVLATGRPGLGFCLCWANESWHRAWDGRSGESLIEQRYSAEDDRAHAEWLAEAFCDPRYLRVDGRPVFLIYRASLLPDPMRTTSLLRDAARRRGIADLLLCRVESSRAEHEDPARLGFDAAVEFQPDWSSIRSAPTHLARKIARRGGLNVPPAAREVVDYERFVSWMRAKPQPPYLRFPCVTPQWDNSARRAGRGAFVLRDSTPELYQKWVAEVATTLDRLPGGQRLLFVNAWNEWAEGCHLEPCERWGHQYLEAHRAGLSELVGVRR